VRGSASQQRWRQQQRLKLLQLLVLLFSAGASSSSTLAMHSQMHGWLIVSLPFCASTKIGLW